MLLQQKNFRFLFFSTLISGTGSWLTILSASWLIQKMYENFVGLAVLNSLGFIGAFLLIPKFSYFVDKYNKVNIAKHLCITGILAHLVFVILIFIFNQSIYILVLIGSFSSLLSSLEPINRVSLVKTMIDKELYAKATKYLELMQQLTSFAAAIIGVILIKTDNIIPVVIFDSLTFIIAYFFINKIKFNSNVNKNLIRNDKNTKNLKIEKTPKYNLIFYFFSISSLFPYICIMSQRVIYPGFFNNILHSSNLVYSLYSLPYAIGALFTIFIITDLSKNISNNKIILFCLIIYSISVLAIPIFKSISVTYICLFFFSLTHCAIRIKRLEILMNIIPNEYFGRISGFFQSITVFSITSLTWISAIVSTKYGIIASWFVFIIPCFIATVFYTISYIKMNKLLTQFSGQANTTR